MGPPRQPPVQHVRSGLDLVGGAEPEYTHLDHLRAAIDADDAIDEVTSKDDVEQSKPDPDIVQTALDKAGLDASDAMFVGDTVWDVEAARRAGLDCVAVLSGGIAEHDLRDAGAVAVYRDVKHLLEDFDNSPIAKLASGS